MLHKLSIKVSSLLIWRGLKFALGLISMDCVVVHLLYPWVWSEWVTLLFTLYTTESLAPFLCWISLWVWSKGTVLLFTFYTFFQVFVVASLVCWALFLPFVWWFTFCTTESLATFLLDLALGLIRMDCVVVHFLHHWKYRYLSLLDLAVGYRGRSN